MKHLLFLLRVSSRLRNFISNFTQSRSSSHCRRSDNFFCISSRQIVLINEKKRQNMKKTRAFLSKLSSESQKSINFSIFLTVTHRMCIDVQTLDEKISNFSCEFIDKTPLTSSFFINRVTFDIFFVFFSDKFVLKYSIIFF